MIDKKSFLQKALVDNQLQVSEAITDQFLAYLKLLEQWSQVHNLTAIRDPKEMIMLHIIDSLSINRFLHGSRLVDVGTGAGLPGIPLALMNPEKEFVLVDSNNKKTLFLNQVIIDLKLKNVKAVHARAEEVNPEKGFDSVITRAFSSLQDMLKVTEHLVAPDGHFLAMKGIYPEDEIQQVPDNFRVLNVYALRINGLHADRHLVTLGKAL